MRTLIGRNFASAGLQIDLLDNASLGKYMMRFFNAFFEAQAFE